MNIDTEKIKKCGDEIISLSKELNEVIELLYSRIVNMPTKTGEWQGSSAEAYAKMALLDKNQAIEFKNVLYSYGVTLINNATKYEKEINNTIL